MNSLPFYKRYARDFFEGSVGMPLEMKGAYGLVLDLMYLHNGKLPDNAHYIAGQLGASVRKWNLLRNELIEREKIYIVKNMISNTRVDKELIIQRSYRDKKAENARGSNENNDLEKRPPTACKNTELDTDKIKEKNTKKENEIFFDNEIWPSYPKKVEKAQSKSACLVALKKIDRETLRTKLAEYVSLTDPQFLITLHRWFSRERWEDEPAQPSYQNSSQRTQAMNDWVNSKPDDGGTLVDDLLLIPDNTTNQGRLIDHE